MNIRIPALSGRLLLAASMVALAGACAKKEAAPVEPAAAEPVAEAVVESEVEPIVEPMVEAVADAAPIGSADITVTMTDGAPAFGSVSVGFCSLSGGCGSGINLAAGGNVDLSGFPPGDVTVNVKLDSSVTGAGYAYPSDPYAAVAIVVIPAGTITSPVPVFGKDNWPDEFKKPSVSGATVTFVDKEDDQQAYEYSIQLVRSDGTTLTMDPKIQNGKVTR